MLLKDKLQGGVGEGATSDRITGTELQLIEFDLHLSYHPYAHAMLLDARVSVDASLKALQVIGVRGYPVLV